MIQLRGNFVNIIMWMIWKHFVDMKIMAWKVTKVRQSWPACSLPDFVVVRSLSSLTLGDPMDCNVPGFQTAELQSQDSRSGCQTPTPVWFLLISHLYLESGQDGIERPWAYLLLGRHQSHNCLQDSHQWKSLEPTRKDLLQQRHKEGTTMRWGGGVNSWCDHL